MSDLKRKNADPLTSEVAPDTKKLRLDHENSSAPNSSPSETRKQFRSNKERPNKRQRAEYFVQPPQVDVDPDSKEKRLPKRKVAVLIGYCGSGYFGSQINPDVSTIEGAVFDAFVKAGCVSPDNAVNPTKVNLLRAARTDAGVHAAVNVLSLKLIINPPSLEEPHTMERLVDHLNGLLVPQIRIWNIIRVQNGYNPRLMCDSRMYNYCMPTYVLLPPKIGSHMANKTKASGLDCNAESVDPAAETTDVRQFWQRQAPSASDPTAAEATPTQDADTKQKENGASAADADKPSASSTVFVDPDIAVKRAWKLTPDLLKATREAAKQYEGNHNFHNFTIAKDFKDRSAKRVIKSVTISEPFMAGGIEWLSIKIHGQSFMLHQIRKMIGLLILLVRSRSPASLVAETFGPQKIHTPKAPSLGLLLEQPYFDMYNKKVQSTNAQYDKQVEKAREQNDKSLEGHFKERIECGDEVTAKVEAFKQEWIHDKMWLSERETCTFAKFTTLLDCYSGPDFLYLNPQGHIPTSCVFVNGKIPSTGEPDATLKAEDDEDVQLAKDADEG